MYSLLLTVALTSCFNSSLQKGKSIKLNILILFNALFSSYTKFIKALLFIRKTFCKENFK